MTLWKYGRSEAGGFVGVMRALTFVPFYASSLIVSHPRALVVQVFTFIAYTAPVTGKLPNGAGSLGPGEAAGLILKLFAVGYVVLRLAVQLLRYGSIEYTKKVSIRAALGLKHWAEQTKRTRPGDEQGGRGRTGRVRAPTSLLAVHVAAGRLRRENAIVRP